MPPLQNSEKETKRARVTLLPANPTPQTRNGVAYSL